MRLFSVPMLVFAALAGCRLPGGDGPISQSLATSRQLSQEGVAAMQRGRWEQAEMVLGEAVRACPGDPEARQHYAEALWHRGLGSKAVAELEEAARLSGHQPKLLVRIAEIRLEMGQIDAAYQSVSRAIDLDPRLAEAWALRARVMQARGETLQAMADYHRALGYAPHNRETLLRLAELYRQMERPERALATLHSLADTYAPGEEPQQVVYLEGLAYTALGRYEAAVGALREATVRGDPNPEVLYRLAEAERLAGRPERAAATALEALALDPQHRASHALLARVGAVPQNAAPLRQ